MGTSGHTHTWVVGRIANGARGEKTNKSSAGATCSECRLVAKAPSKPPKDWRPAP